jgi:hypothetical protein
MNKVARRDGTRLLYSLKPGESAKMTTYGVIVCHADREPKLVNWDGSEEPITIDADQSPSRPA